MQENRAELGKEIDTSKYVAGAVVVFDLHMREIKWIQHLDLSTDYTQYRAYIYSAPTLADVDLDGKPEIIVGTSMVRSTFVHQMVFQQLCRHSVENLKPEDILPNDEVVRLASGAVTSKGVMF